MVLNINPPGAQSPDRGTKINKYKEVEELAQKLIKISKIRNQKYHFKESYLYELFRIWEKNPGKCIIHLFDLPDHITVDLNNTGRSKLRQVYNKLRKKGLDRLSRKYKTNLYKFHDYINNRTERPTIKTLKELNNISSEININKLEKNITSIISGRRSNVLYLKQGFPIRLDTNEWAFIFGVIPDSHLKKFSFWSVNEKFVKQILDNLREIGLTNLNIKKENRKTEDSQIISILLSLSGIDIHKNQLYCNNPFPIWFFNTRKEFQQIVLSKIIDTEGNFNKRMIRIAQSNSINLSKEEIKDIIPKNKRYIIKQSNSLIHIQNFSQLSNELKSKVLSNPPLILITSQLLLIKNRIYSTLYPTRITISNSSTTSEWQLIIQGYGNLKRFYEISNEHLILKISKLKDYLKNKQNHLPKNLSKAYYLLNALEIEKQKGHFHIKEVIESCKKKDKTVYNIFRILIVNNYIQKIGKKGRFNRFIISVKGREFLKDYPDFDEFKSFLL